MVRVWFRPAPDEGRDAASLPDPVTLDGRFILRGSMDLVERHPAGALRVTDHKTGRARWPDRMIVAGGEVLQPVLYGLALEAATGAARSRGATVVLHGRRRVCRCAGAVDRDDAAESGWRCWRSSIAASSTRVLAPYPKEGACEWCDFRVVCGSGEERRTGRKIGGRFPDLDDLRGKS